MKKLEGKIAVVTRARCLHYQKPLKTKLTDYYWSVSLILKGYKSS